MGRNFSIAADLDIPSLARQFAENGRVTIPNFLNVQQADDLYAMLKGRDDWLQVINSGEKLVELDRETRASVSAEKRTALDDAVYAGARRGFQFRYETIRVPDEAATRKECADPLADFAHWLSCGKTRECLRSIAGTRAIRFADAQATAYSPGDFLTRHDDNVAGKNRHAAYVLSLTPGWRIEYGGLLLFHSTDDRFAEALVPVFNQLNIFSVPQPHSVSMVTRITPVRRYSITGWLRG